MSWPEGPLKGLPNGMAGGGLRPRSELLQRPSSSPSVSLKDHLTVLKLLWSDGSVQLQPDEAAESSGDKASTSTLMHFTRSFHS